MGYKKYDASGKISAAEKVVNGDTSRVIEVFFENVDNVKTRVTSLLVGWNDTNGANSTEVQNVLNILQEHVKFHPLKWNVF